MLVSLKVQTCSIQMNTPIKELTPRISADHERGIGAFAARQISSSSTEPSP